MAKKRANGEGNIRKRADGRWEGRYTAGSTGIIVPSYSSEVTSMSSRSPCILPVPTTTAQRILRGHA